MTNNMYCTKCGSTIGLDARFCAKCGTEIKSSLSPTNQTVVSDQDKSEKSAVTTLLLCMFLGALGIHRFYVGKVGTGILMLLTGGGLGIWTLVDLVLIASCHFTDSKGKYLVFSRGRASPLKLILLIVGSIVAALVAYVILLVTLLVCFTSSMMDTVRNQLQALRRGDINTAYSYMSAVTKETLSLNHFEKFVSNYPIMTSNISASFPERRMINNEGYAIAILKAKNGANATVEYRLIKENKNWKILSIHIQNQESTATSKQTESVNSAYKIYDDKNNHFSIKYPANWNYEYTKKGAVLFSGKKGTASYYSTISIIVIPYKKPGSAYENVKSATNNIKNGILTRYANAKFIDGGEVELPLNPKKYHGEYFVAIYTYKGVAIKNMEFIISNDSGQMLYVWGYTSPAKQYDNDLPVAKNMYESWLID